MNMSNSTTPIHPTEPGTSKPMAQTKAAPAQKRNNFTRSPVWSLNHPHAYGANTRVTACTAVSNPITVMEKPKSLSHKGK